MLQYFPAENVQHADGMGGICNRKKSAIKLYSPAISKKKVLSSILITKKCLIYYILLSAAIPQLHSVSYVPAATGMSILHTEGKNKFMSY